MSHLLTHLSPGFEDVERDSQVIFRQVMQSFSRPGLLVDLSPRIQCDPTSEPSVSGAILLALLQSGSTLHLPAGEASAHWGRFLKFHTSCELITEAQHAHFIWAPSPRDIPRLESCALGSAEFPEHCTTLIIDVPEILCSRAPAPGRLWQGPGIEDPLYVQVKGVDEAFWTQRQALRELYPCGVDVIFCASTQMISLPRSTRVGEP
jgi:alpha-D-ribose 1-methylphosphonate 5-triphosphate synthase subunit PhnH